MHTPQELELLALAQAERQRNNSPNLSQEPQMRTASSQVPSVGPLPDLTPDMLLSASARREVEAAQKMFWQQTPSVPRAAVREPQQASRMTAREYRAQENIEMSLSEDMGDIDLDSEGQVPQVTANDDMLLSSLFMGREAQDAQAVLGGGEGYAASGYDIAFDSDSMIEGRTSPNESARWQVGRQSPPRTPFSARMDSGPSDGTVVSSRRPGGGWERSASAAPRPEPQASSSGIVETLRQGMLAQHSRATQAVTHSRPAPSRAVPPPAHVHRPTVYEHIMRGGFLDDD